MVKWLKSIVQACDRLVDFIGTCTVDVQGVQNMQFALADFEAELSMALGSGPEHQTSPPEPLPGALYDMVCHKDASVRAAGWRAMTFVLKSKVSVDVLDFSTEEGGTKKLGERGRHFVLHLVRALDGGGGSNEEQLESLELVLALCTQTTKDHQGMATSAGEDLHFWSLVLPPVAGACHVHDFEASGEAPLYPRVLIKALEVLRNIAVHLPDQITCLRHIEPLLSTLCSMSFLDQNNSYCLNVDQAQREIVAMASQQALSSMLAQVTARKNLGWDPAIILGPILTPFLDLAISEMPRDEDGIRSWDAPRMRLLPNCMQGLFRLAQSWTGVFLLTTHTKNEKSVLEVLVQAFADTKVAILRCVFVMLFTGLLGLPMQQDALEYWIEESGIKLDFDGIYFGSDALKQDYCLNSPWEGEKTGEGRKSFVELANRVHRGVLTSALFEAGLHYHLKNAMKHKHEPKRSIPALMDAFVELAHFCLPRHDVMAIQGSHDRREEVEEDGDLLVAAKEGLPDMAYLVSQSEMKGNQAMNKLQRIVLTSNASSTTTATVSEERKTIAHTLSNVDTVKKAMRDLNVDSEFNVEEASQSQNELEEKLLKLQDLMTDSGVLKYSSKHWRHWKWEYFALILDLCKGIPEEGVKLCLRSKLLKRVFAFYAKRLPSVPVDNYKGRVGIQCGMELLKLLLETEEGRNFLSGKFSFLDQLPEVNLFEVIVKGLQMETAGSTDAAKGRIFHPAMVRHTHAFGLVQMALHVADTKKGAHMLYRMGVTQALEQVIQDGRNPELCKKIFGHLNLRINDFPQKILEKVLDSPGGSDTKIFTLAALCLNKNLSELSQPGHADDSERKQSLGSQGSLLMPLRKQTNREGSLKMLPWRHSQPSFVPWATQSIFSRQE